MKARAEIELDAQPTEPPGTRRTHSAFDVFLEDLVFCPLTGMWALTPKGPFITPISRPETPVRKHPNCLSFRRQTCSDELRGLQVCPLGGVPASSRWC